MTEATTTHESTAGDERQVEMAQLVAALGGGPGDRREPDVRRGPGRPAPSDLPRDAG